MNRSRSGPPHGGHSDPSSLQSFDLRDWLWRLRRYGWLLVLPIVTCLCVAAVVTRHTKPLYQAYLLVTVDESSDVSPGMRPLVQGGTEAAGPRERVILVDGKIHNHRFLRAVAERVGMNKDPILNQRAREATKILAGITPEDYVFRLAVGRLWNKISVSPGRGSIIQIAVSDTDPEAARYLASIIGDVLVEESLQATLMRVQARGDFSQDQIAVYEDRLRQAENELGRFQEGLVRKNLSTGIITDRNLTFAQGLQRSTDEEIAQLRSRILSGREEWQATAGNATPPTLSSDRTRELTTQLGSLEISSALGTLTGGGTTAGTDVVQARIASTRQGLFAEFDRLATAAAGEFPPAARSAVVGISLDRAVLSSLQARRDRLASTINDYLRNVERSPRDQIELQRLQDNVTSARNILTTLRNEAVSSRISEALATSSVGPRLEIVERPLLPLTPSGPGARTSFALAAFLGLVIAAGIVFAGERLAAVVRTVEQAEAEYGLRVIGVIPRIESRPRPGGYLKNRWPVLAVITVVLLTALVIVIDETLLTQHPKPGQVQRAD